MSRAAPSIRCRLPPSALLPYRSCVNARRPPEEAPKIRLCTLRLQLVAGHLVAVNRAAESRGIELAAPHDAGFAGEEDERRFRGPAAIGGRDDRDRHARVPAERLELRRIHRIVAV